jgi:hypothetical protein
MCGMTFVKRLMGRGERKVESRWLRVERRQRRGERVEVRPPSLRFGAAERERS